MAGTGIKVTIQGDGEQAKQALDMVERKLKELGEASKREGSAVSTALSQVSAGLSGLGVAVGVGQVISMMKEMTGQSIELGMEIGRLSQQTGISAENLSTLKYAADVTGVSFEALSKGFKKLALEYATADQGSVKSQANFARLGLSMQEVRKYGDDMYGLLAVVADKFKEMPEGMEKSAAASDLFGQRMGSVLIPFLNKGSQGIADLREECRELGVELDASGVQKLEEVHRATVQSTAAWHGLWLELTTMAAPALERVAHAGTGALEILRGFAALDLSGAGGNLAGNGLGVDPSLIARLPAVPGGKKDAVSPKAAPADPRSLAENQMEQAQARLLAARVAFAEKAGAATLSAVTKASKDVLAALEQEHKVGLLDEKKYLEQKLQLVEQNNKAVRQATGKSENPLFAAEAALAQANATALDNRQRAAMERSLALLEQGHKGFLMADEEYYSNKLDIQQRELQSEEDSLRSRVKDLEALRAKQHDDPAAKFRDGKGRTPDELKTLKEIATLNAQINGVLEKRAMLNDAAEAAQQERAEELKLTTARAAAMLEAGTNDSIEARLHLMEVENELALKRVAAEAGVNSELYKSTQAYQKQQEQMLRAADLQRQIRDIEQEAELKVSVVKDKQEKNPVPGSEIVAEREINAIHAQEARLLKEKIALYQQLGQQLGGPYLETAKALQVELGKLNNPDTRSQAKFAKTLSEGMTSLTDHIVEQAARGKASFSEMAEEMGADALKLALKLIQIKVMERAAGATGGDDGADGSEGASGGGFGGFLKSIFGAGGEHHMSGGVGSDMPQVVGEAGPELWEPPTRGGSYLTNDMLKGIADKGGSNGRAPNVTTTVVNQSSQPVQATTSQPSYDSQAREYFTHIILTDLHEGGMISQALGR